MGKLSLFGISKAIINFLNPPNQGAIIGLQGELFQIENDKTSGTIHFKQEQIFYFRFPYVAFSEKRKTPKE